MGFVKYPVVDLLRFVKQVIIHVRLNSTLGTLKEPKADFRGFQGYYIIEWFLYARLIRRG